MVGSICRGGTRGYEGPTVHEYQVITLYTLNVLQFCQGYLNKAENSFICSSKHITQKLQGSVLGTAPSQKDTSYVPTGSRTDKQAFTGGSAAQGAEGGRNRRQPCGGASPAPRPRGEARPREQDPTCAKFKTGTANPCRGRPAGTTRRERRGLLGCWGRAVTWVCSFCDSSLICALVTCALFYPCITGTSQKRRSADRTHQGTTK